MFILICKCLHYYVVCSAWLDGMVIMLSDLFQDLTLILLKNLLLCFIFIPFLSYMTCHVWPSMYVRLLIVYSTAGW